MKRIITISIILLLCADCLAQSPDQVVRNYVSLLNDWLASPYSSEKRKKVMETLNGGESAMKDEIVERFNSDAGVSHTSPGNYLAIIYEKTTASRVRVEIVSLKVKTDDGERYVTAQLKYTGGISLLTVSDFWISGGKITGIVSNEREIARLRSTNTNNQRSHPNNTARDNSRDSINIELMRKARNCLYERDQLKLVPYIDLKKVDAKLDSARIYLTQAADNGDVLSEIVLGFLMFDDRLRDILADNNIYQKEFCENPTRGKHTIGVKVDIGYQKYHVKYFRNIISKYASSSQSSDKYCVGYAYYALYVIKKQNDGCCGMDALIPESEQTLLDKSVEYNCDVVQLARAFDIKEKNAEQAQALLDKVIEQNRSSYFVEDALYLLGVISFANKDYQVAYNYFEKAATDEWPDHYIHSGADYLIKHYGDLFDEPKKNHKTLVSLINRGWYHYNNHDITSYDFIYHKVIWGLH